MGTQSPSKQTTWEGNGTCWERRIDNAQMMHITELRRLVLVSWFRYTGHKSFHTWVPQQIYITTKEMTLERIYHGVRIQVVCRLQRHPDCPRSHHTLCHRFHWCRLQPYPWLVHPCWSKCNHPPGDCNNLESHQLLEAWHHLQCKRLMEERRTSISNNFSWIWSCQNIYIFIFLFFIIILHEITCQGYIK